MSLTPDAEPTEEQVKVHLDIYPEGSPEIQLRQIAVGMQPGVFITIDAGEEEGTADLGLTISCLTPEEALDVIQLAQLSINRYLGMEEGAGE